MAGIRKRVQAVTAPYYAQKIRSNKTLVSAGIKQQHLRRFCS
jgi:hypothetical protein